MFMVLGSLLNALYISTQFCDVGTFIMANLRMRKQAQRPQ